jgi:hypothetical protein
MPRLSLMLVGYVALFFCSSLADRLAGGPDGVQVLFHQLANPVPAAVLNSQQTYPYNSMLVAADDFVVPTGMVWRIERVTIRGRFSEEINGSVVGGHNLNWKIKILEGAPSTPSSIVSYQANDIVALDIRGGLGTSFEVFVFDLPTPPELLPGSYWISVYPNSFSSTPYGNFYWQLTDQNNLNIFNVLQKGSHAECIAQPFSLWLPYTSCSNVVVIEDTTTLGDIARLNGLVFLLEGPATPPAPKHIITHATPHTYLELTSPSPSTSTAAALESLLSLVLHLVR